MKFPGPHPAPWHSLSTFWPHESRIRWYLSFCDGFVSLSVMAAKFIHAVAGVRAAFLVQAQCDSTAWLEHGLLARSSVDGLLACFHLLATANKAALTMGAQYLLQTLFQVFWVHTTKWDSRVPLWGSAMLFSLAAAPVRIPTSLPTLAVFSSSSFLILGILMGGGSISLWFWLAFPQWLLISRIFSYACWKEQDVVWREPFGKTFWSRGHLNWQRKQTEDTNRQAGYPSDPQTPKG